MLIEKKIEDYGLKLPDAPKPGGIYVPCKVVNNLVFISGQTSAAREGQKVVGVVGDSLTIEEGQKAAEICALNMLAVLKQELGDLDRVKQFVQIIGYVRSAKDFTDQAMVINGASQLLRDLYGDAGLAVRLAIGINEIPAGAAVEIMGIAEI